MPLIVLNYLYIGGTIMKQKDVEIDWQRPISESIESIIKLIKEKKPIEENFTGEYRIPIKDKYNETAEAIVIRGSIKEHQISTGIASSDHAIYKSLTISLTITMGENEEVFIFTASDFENSIQFNNRDFYEILFIGKKSYIKIKKIF